MKASDKKNNADDNFNALYYGYYCIFHNIFKLFEFV